MEDDDIYLHFLMNETLLCKMTSRNPCMGDTINGKLIDKAIWQSARSAILSYSHEILYFDMIV